jgi:ElaB/YqjD/DUF883 family membrane-anchored ribosome-binding protein
MQNNQVNNISDDMNSLVKDANGLLQEANTAAGEKATELRDKAMKLLDNVLTRAQDVQSSAIATSKELAQNADGYVQHNPWRAVSVSAGIGLLLGFLLARK